MTPPKKRKSIDIRRPVLAASIAVWRGNDVLLVQRGKPPLEGLWSLPGGRVEFGEPVRDAALRELHEETGILAEIVALTDIVDVIGPGDADLPAHHFAITSFTGLYVSGEARAGDDAADARWARVEDLPEIALTSGTEAVIHKANKIITGIRCD